MKLSIITICYNEKKRIEQTIQSVLNQTFKAYQYIVIDGASNDGTVDIIKKYNDKINVFISEPDTGIYNAMNKGLQYAEGEYIQFLNGGDFLANGKVLENVFSVLHNEDILYGYLRSTEKKTIKNLSNINIKKYLKTNTLPHQASFVKQKIFYKTKGFDERFKIAGDYDFFTKAILKYNATTKYLPVLVAVFNTDGISNKLINLVKKEKKRVQNRAKLKKKHTLSTIKFLFQKLKKPKLIREIKIKTISFIQKGFYQYFKKSLL